MLCWHPAGAAKVAAALSLDYLAVAVLLWLVLRKKTDRDEELRKEEQLNSLSLLAPLDR